MLTQNAEVKVIRAGSKWQIVDSGVTFVVAYQNDTLKIYRDIRDGAQQLLALATVEVLFFFIVLLIAFAYEWKLGALDWVRALADEYSQKTKSGRSPPAESKPVLSA